MNLLGGHHGETGGQVEAHLVPEHRQGPRSGPVGLLHTVGEDTLEEIVVLQHRANVADTAGAAMSNAAVPFALHPTGFRRREPSSNGSGTEKG